MYIPAKSTSPEAPSTALVPRLQGLGCGCGGKCGMGLFESGLDVSQWGALEWGAVLIGGYVLFSTVSTTRRGVDRVRKSVRSRRSKARRRSELKKELASL